MASSTKSTASRSSTARTSPTSCRTCDSCRLSPSVLFCRADDAFLCGACDAEIHSANKLASRHHRVCLCAVCEQAPAAVTCKADAASLCLSCDAAIHSSNPLASRHHRFPILGADDAQCCRSGGGGGFFSSFLKSEQAELDDDFKSADYFFSDGDPYLNLDHNDNVAAAAADSADVPADYVVAPRLQQPANSSYSTYSVCSSEVGVVPDASGDMSTGGNSAGSQTTSITMGMDRKARVIRYREKRKNRRFEKTIRYASRKAYAETRPRIKGRFAKRTEVEVDEVEAMINVDGGFGVVPSC